MVFGFVGTLALDVFCLLDSAWKSCIPLFPAILTLGHTGIYVHPSDGGNVVSYVETSIYETFCLTSTLNISDVQPDYSHIQLQRDLDNIRFWGQNNIIENVVLFNDVFNYIWYNRRGYIFLEIRDTYDFEIRLQLREIENFNSFQINIICGLDIVLNGLEIWS